MNDAKVSIQIASCGNHLFEVRIVGPGGWRTSISQASLSACQSDATAWSRVLGVPVEACDV